MPGFNIPLKNMLGDRTRAQQTGCFQLNKMVRFCHVKAFSYCKMHHYEFDLCYQKTLNIRYTIILIQYDYIYLTIYEVS